ncbi:MAG: hypothetical protein IH948_03185 [Bacteroidetes bacterium]|nr:hypothetical protein [Bacteroidota bacterium]
MKTRISNISIHPVGYTPWTIGVKQNKFSNGANVGGNDARHLNFKTMKTITKTIGMALVLMVLSIGAYAQKPIVGILNIDTKGVVHDPAAMSYMVRLEVEKTGVFSVMDKYDVNDIMEKSGIDIEDCYGKTCLVKAGIELKVEKMLTGSVERFGEKIVITLRLIDVMSGAVEKSDAMEYLNLQPNIQKMIEVSVKNLFEIENDQNLVNLLVDYETVITSPKTTLMLDGPRMGISVTTGDAAERLQASKNEGGYEMYPIMSQFGYQFETQYLSAGNFQALIEYIFLVGGLESGQFIPSISFLNGFRGGKSGWEFGFGPTFKIVKMARGFYDKDKLFNDIDDNETHWYLEHEWNELAQDKGLTDTGGIPVPLKYATKALPDSRGQVKLSTSLVIAIGKTFKSGYLNVPVNVYVVPNKKGTIVGASFGFNINKTKRVQ